jgi:hypothetical protein
VYEKLHPRSAVRLDGDGHGVHRYSPLVSL